MQRFYVDVLQGKGSYYELGLLAGEKLKNSPLFYVHQKRRKQSLRSYNIDFKQVKNYFAEFAPFMWEEFEGLAEALDWPLFDVVHEYSGFQTDDVNSGCSALMNGGIFARNYDFHPKTYEGRLLLWQPEQGYASIGISGRLVGRIDGMNEKGLVVAFHFVNRHRAEDGFTCSIIARMILDTCATTEEAIRLLSTIPHRHSFNYSLYDAFLQSAVVEASPRGVYIFRNTAVCANHFQSNKLEPENRHHIAESKQRLSFLQSYASTVLKNNQAYSLFNNPSFGIFKKNYSNWSGTLHTTIYQPKTLNVLVGIGENARPTPIYFKQWLSGKRIPVTRIFGVVDSTEPFLHM